MAKGKNKETKVPDKIVKYVDKKLKAAERREEELKWFGYGLADTGVYNGAGYIQQNIVFNTTREHRLNKSRR